MNTRGAGASGGVPVLWHLPHSHYNDKARWALDYKGIPHVRKAVHPGPHVKIARELWGGTTLPALEIDGEVIGDSTRIIEELERRFPQRSLYPSDPEARARALELEDFFDEELGTNVRVVVLDRMLRDPGLLITFLWRSTGMRRAITRAMFPGIRRKIRQGLDINDATVEQAYRNLRAVGERFRSELQPTGYLVGDSFTVADLTAAALATPGVSPNEFPSPHPQRQSPLLDPVRAVLSESGLDGFCRAMYRRHRGESAEVPATEASGTSAFPQATNM